MFETWDVFEVSLHLSRVQLLLQVNAELLSDVLQLLEVGLVLLRVLNLVLQSLEGSDGSWVVVDSSTSLQSLLDDRWSWDQIVRETVVQDSLDLEQVVSLLKLVFVSVVSICCFDIALRWGHGQKWDREDLGHAVNNNEIPDGCS